MFGKFGKAEYSPSTEARDSLKELVADAIRRLRTGIVEFGYPPELKCRKGKIVWKKKYRSIDTFKGNQEILGRLGKKGGRAGVYAILTQQNRPYRVRDRWCVKYIGKVKAGQSRQRLRSHLVWKNKKTGSKLDDVQDAVTRGHRIGISFVEIHPVTLRHYVEDKLIDKCCPIWNNHGIPDRKKGKDNRCRCDDNAPWIG